MLPPGVRKSHSPVQVLFFSGTCGNLMKMENLHIWICVMNISGLFKATLGSLKNRGSDIRLVHRPIIYYSTDSQTWGKNTAGRPTWMWHPRSMSNPLASIESLRTHFTAKQAKKIVSVPSHTSHCPLRHLINSRFLIDIRTLNSFFSSPPYTLLACKPFRWCM